MTTGRWLSAPALYGNVDQMLPICKLLCVCVGGAGLAPAVLESSLRHRNFQEEVNCGQGRNERPPFPPK